LANTRACYDVSKITAVNYFVLAAGVFPLGMFVHALGPKLDVAIMNIFFCRMVDLNNLSSNGGASDVVRCCGCDVRQKIIVEISAERDAIQQALFFARQDLAIKVCICYLGKLLYSLGRYGPVWPYELSIL
jgi:hypothetical protein